MELGTENTSSLNTSWSKKLYVWLLEQKLRRRLLFLFKKQKPEKESPMPKLPLLGRVMSHG